MTKIQYEPAEDVFYAGGKKISHKSKKFPDILVQYVCDRVSQGQAISEVIPTASRIWPTITELMQLLNSSEAFRTRYKQAEGIRALVLKERLIGAIRRHERDPSDDTRRYVEAIHQSIKMIERSGGKSDHITIEFQQNFPEDYWD